MKKYKFKIRDSSGEHWHTIFIDKSIDLEKTLRRYNESVDIFDLEEFVNILRNKYPDVHIHGAGLMSDLERKLRKL